MEEKVFRILKWGACILAACFFLFGGRVSVQWGATDKPEAVVDTSRVVVYDTITFFRPVAKDSVAVRYVTRMLPVECGVDSDECGVDSDCVRVVMPITQRTYETEDYKAWVSGYEARLDSIFVFNRTVRERITVPAAKPQGTVAARMGIGVVGGAGYGIINRQPDIFVGVAAYVRLWP